jgi:hypothetical protein
MFDRCSKVLVSGSALFLLAAIGCSADAGRVGKSSGADSDGMSTTIYSTYGLTSFGGSGDCQSVACGGSNSCDLQEWYSASSQRYGCNVHLQVTSATNGKCVVVETEDAGPASWVEADAGIPILDASPAVALYLFGVSGGLGWSDNADNPGMYDVNVSVTNAPLGPCDGSGGGGTGGGGSTGSGGGGGDGSGSATACTLSSGEQGTCIDTSECASQGGTSTAGYCPGAANIECCTGGGDGSGSQDSTASQDSTGSQDSGQGSGSGSGAACSTDGQCNPGSEGSGQICVNGTCVAGCNADWECPGNETCQGGQCQ